MPCIVIPKVKVSTSCPSPLRRVRQNLVLVLHPLMRPSHFTTNLGGRQPSARVSLDIRHLPWRLSPFRLIDDCFKPQCLVRSVGNVVYQFIELPPVHLHSRFRCQPLHCSEPPASPSERSLPRTCSKSGTRSVRHTASRCCTRIWQPQIHNQTPGR